MKTKLATSVSTTGLVAVGGGDVSAALGIDLTHEILGLLGGAGINVAQKAFQ
ncbi:MAG TPA: hypothetical protein VGR71_10140 [Nitrospira sp.]|nr:hypothetical protein [Nitrospira sp.]